MSNTEPIDSANFGEIAPVENLLRQNLNPVEESEALQGLTDEHAYKQEDRARIIGNSVPTISEALAMGLVNKLVPKEQLNSEVTALAKELCARPP
jgi:ParB-like chromosome segregation protein Spo0J